MEADGRVVHHCGDHRAWDDATAELATLRAQLADAQARLAVAEGVIAKLPRTADGMPVVPGMEMYHCCGHRIGDAKMFRSACYLGTTEKCRYPEGACEGVRPRRIIEWSDVYSTPSAAALASGRQI